MNLNDALRTELLDLLVLYSSGAASDGQFDRLEELLDTSEEARIFYLKALDVHAGLYWYRRQGEDVARVGSPELSDADTHPVKSDRPCATISSPDGESASPAAGRPVADPLTAFPTIDLGARAAHGAFGVFASGWPVAYLVATVIFAIGLVIGAVVHVSQPASVVQHVSPLPSPIPPSPSVIGRITAMVDCALDNDECRMPNAELRTQKADIHHSSFITQHSPIHLGDRIALKSGLLEIAYDTGAKVILQGPITYDVESPSGGFLLFGKLTARLDGYPPIPNHPSEITNHKSFAVRTPTAIVTDLGTEFGVEVSKDGRTVSHVFRGSVEVRVVSAGGRPTPAPWTLHESESVEVAPPVVPAKESVSEMRRIEIDPSRFVQRLPADSATNDGLPMQVVAWFRLGEDDAGAVAGSKVATATINRKGHYHLSPRTKPTYSANAAPGGSSMSVHFAGADDECLAHAHTPYVINEDFVLEAWAFPRHLKKNGYQFVAYNGDPDRNGYGLCVGEGRWHVLLGLVQMVDTGAACQVGVWTHLALVGGRDRVQFWMNGQPVGEPVPRRPRVPTSSFSIGCDHTTNPPFSFDGEIDEVRLSKLTGPFRPEMLLYRTLPPHGEKGEAGH